MIFIDTETTDLLKSSANDISNQPKITEICIIKTNDDLTEIVEEYTTLINPEIPIPEHITKITGITDCMVLQKPVFAEVYPKIAEIFLGEKTVIAHNCVFDMGVLWCELSRIEKEFRFPWPMHWLCTVEKSFHIKNKRLKLGELHLMATGEEHKQNAHRAKDDVFALIRCFAWLREEGHL